MRKGASVTDIGGARRRNSPYSLKIQSISSDQQQAMTYGVMLGGFVVAGAIIASQLGEKAAAGSLLSCALLVGSLLAFANKGSIARSIPGGVALASIGALFGKGIDKAIGDYLGASDEALPLIGALATSILLVSLIPEVCSQLNETNSEKRKESISKLKEESKGCYGPASPSII